MYLFGVDWRRLRVFLGLGALALVGFLAAAWTPARVTHLRNETVIRIWFPFPMETDSVVERLVLVEEIPGTAKVVGIRWKNPFTAEVWVREPEELQGQKITILWRTPSRLPLISKSSRVSFRRCVVPRLIDFSAVAPTVGPIFLRFNAPIDPVSVRENIKLDFAGRLEPAAGEAQGTRFVDYSRWMVFPEPRLRHERIYSITLTPAVRSRGGLTISGPRVITFRTPGPVKVVGTSPGNGDRNVPLHPDITVEFDQEVSWGAVKVTDIPGGKTRVRGKRLEFTPNTVLMPDRTYTATVQGFSAQGEPSPELTFSFRTIDLGDRLWVAVDLSGEHTVSVYRGDKLIRRMIASGGKPESPTPPGTYQLYTRGHSFWSAKFGEGAYFYVQFMGDYLFHSVPFDESGAVKEEEHQKLGKPASHGCVRLSLADAKWFYDNVPDGTLVVIYQ